MKLIDAGHLKPFFLGHVLFLLAIGLSACNFFERSPEEYIESAYTYLEQGDFTAAIIELKSALQITPDNVEARKLLADTYLSSGKGVEAEKELRRAIDLGMSRVTGETTLARALLMQAKFQQIIDSPIGPRAAPKHKQAELWSLRGEAYVGLNNLQAADTAYHSALALDATLPEARIGRARLAVFMRNDLNTARKVAQEVSVSNPSFMPAWALLGDVHLTEGELEQAEAMYGRAIELSYYLTPNSLKRADVRLRNGDIPGAIEDINSLKEIGYVDPALFYIEGRAHFENAAWTDAQRAFEQAIELAPKHWPAKVYLASIHVSQGRRQQALTLAQQLTAQKPDVNYLKGLLAVAYINERDFLQAKKHLELAVKNSPGDVYILSLLGQITLQEGKPELALEYLSRAVAIDPDSAELRQQLRVAQLIAGEGVLLNAFGDDEERFLSALHYFKKGDYQAALAIAQQLHDETPQAVDPLNLASACLLASGNTLQAKLTLERVLKIEPNNPSAARNLAIIEWRSGNLARAEVILSNLLVVHPQDEAAVLVQAAVKSEQKKTEELVELLQQSLQVNASSYRIRSMLALAYYNAGRIDELLMLVRNTPSRQLLEQSRLLELQGKAYLLRGELDLAVTTFALWVDQQPTSAHAHFFYADALSRAGKPGLAKQALALAVSANPNYLAARVGEVKMLMQDKLLDQARRAMAKLKQDFGVSPAVLGLEGWLLLAVGDFAGAEEALSQAVELQPSMDVSLLLARALWAQAKYQPSLQVLQQSLTQRPGELPVLLQLAEGQMARGLALEAVDTYQVILYQAPDNVLTLNNIAWLTRESNLEQAIIYAERAHQLAPEASGVADTLAMLLLQQNSASDRAFSLLQKAAKQAPYNAEIQLHFGEILLARVNHKEARKVLKTMVLNTPDSPFVKQAQQLLSTIPQP
ncbi:hypothetical protein A9Q89_04485 [Gammaproteobacteria bacterium 53_120_T64]|nr:hypothetical protein A9Q89_04485 [Gammaproteobacteria bacterium 53_120_T64]